MNTKNIIRYIRDKLLYNNDHDYLRMIANHVYNRTIKRQFYPYLETLLADYEFAQTLPRDIDVVIGIPRQGLITADIIANTLGIPLATSEGFIDGVWWQSEHTPVPKIRKVLIVDDSVGSGKTLKDAKEKLKAAFPKIKFLTGATYEVKAPKGSVDFYYKRSTINMFERGIIHENIGKLGCDMDGVLCKDLQLNPTEKERVHHYKTAKPLHIPAYEIEVIATGRFERYRLITERWLKRNNVKYKYLVMRKAEGCNFSPKVRAIQDYHLRWFWESDMEESKMLNCLTGRVILCWENMYMYK